MMPAQDNAALRYILRVLIYVTDLFRSMLELALRLIPQTPEPHDDEEDNGSDEENDPGLPIPEDLNQFDTEHWFAGDE